MADDCRRKRYQQAQALRRATILDIAWAAGFLEGEAHFCPQIAVHQVDKEPLTRLLECFGGLLLLGPDRYPDNPAYHRQWIWRVNGARARGVALTIYPFLSEKRQQQVREKVLNMEK